MGTPLQRSIEGAEGRNTDKSEDREGLSGDMLCARNKSQPIPQYRSHNVLPRQRSHSDIAVPHRQHNKVRPLGQQQHGSHVRGTSPTGQLLNMTDLIKWDQGNTALFCGVFFNYNGGSREPYAPA